MQEYIINGLLIVVALLAVILQIIGMRPSAGMTKKQKVMLWRILTATVLLLILQVLGAGAFEVFGSAGRWVRLAVFLVDYLVIGYDILKKAGKGIRNGQVFDEHFLMAVATLGALALAVYENGDYLEAIAVMLFYQVGEWFQSYAVGKSRRNISDLMDIRPDYANIEREGKLEQVDPDEVGIGTIIVVQPGEKVPIDGMVVQGESTLNTAALTGESLPREVKTGDEIISGCINMTGLLHIQTTKEFGESTVSKILDLVENASSRKSKSEDFISRFAKIYTPAVCYAALALAVLPPLVRMFAMGLDAGWETWIYRALTFLVASCPCALVISIPLSFFAGIGGASKAGVLVKGSNYLETLSRAKIVVFDKTGTLTLGLTDGAEQLRPGAAEAVRALRDRGMELWMISGDKREKAERIAGMLGIENVLCEVRPADKSDAVKALQARGKRVCFVGDGINDSPALACADIGVALGCGADIAISTADVMIVSSSMQSVQTVFDISAATMKNVRQNLIWAAVYNVICIPLAASGIINPSIAAAAMALSSNGVLLNALRLKKYEPRTI